MEKHTCAFRFGADHETLKPIGPQCGKKAVQEIVWDDGRVSPSCLYHGYSSLTPEARSLVARVNHPKTEGEWLTKG